MNQFMQVIRERENKKKEIKLSITSKRGQIYNTGNKLPAAVVAMSIAEIYHLCLPKNVLVIGSVDYELNPDPMFSLAYNITHAKQSGFDYIFCLVQEDYRIYKNKEKDVRIVNSYNELVNLLKEQFGGD